MTYNDNHPVRREGSQESTPVKERQCFDCPGVAINNEDMRRAPRKGCLFLSRPKDEAVSQARRLGTTFRTPLVTGMHNQTNQLPIWPKHPSPERGRPPSVGMLRATGSWDASRGSTAQSKDGSQDVEDEAARLSQKSSLTMSGDSRGSGTLDDLVRLDAQPGLLAERQRALVVGRPYLRHVKFAEDLRRSEAHVDREESVRAAGGMRGELDGTGRIRRVDDRDRPQQRRGALVVRRLPRSRGEG